MSTNATALTTEPTVDPNVGAGAATTNAGGAATTSSDTNQDWRSSLPEDLRASPSLQKFKNAGDLAKSYTELEKMPVIRLPKADAKPEEYDALYAKLGRPESADKYEFKRPAVAEGLKYDEELETAFKGMAFKSGLQPRQAQALLDSYNALQSERATKSSTEMAAGLETIKKEWGADYDKNVKFASQAVTEFGGDSLKQFYETTGLGNHPEEIKAWTAAGKQITALKAQIAELTAEDKHIDGDTNVDSNSADAIQAKINAIRNDPKHPYRDKNATPKSRDAAIKEMDGLYMQLAAVQGEAS